jgi:hypothetical protein
VVQHVVGEHDGEGICRERQFLRIRDDIDRAFSELAARRLKHSG